MDIKLFEAIQPFRQAIDHCLSDYECSQLMCKGEKNLELLFKNQSLLMNVYKEALKKYGKCLPTCWSENDRGAPCDCKFQDIQKLI